MDCLHTQIMQQYLSIYICRSGMDRKELLGHLYDERKDIYGNLNAFGSVLDDDEWVGHDQKVFLERRGILIVLFELYFSRFHLLCWGFWSSGETHNQHGMRSSRMRGTLIPVKASEISPPPLMHDRVGGRRSIGCFC